MNIEVVAINKDNWSRCIELEVKPHQLGDVGSNVLSLAELCIRPEAKARAILRDGHEVGMAVYLLNSEDNKYHVHRFMIDKRFQGQGIGETSLRLIVKEIQSLPDYEPPLRIEFINNNANAERLYTKVGFRDTGRTVQNEEWGFVEKVFEIE